METSTRNEITPILATPDSDSKGWRTNPWSKTIAMYLTMVVVSTLAIYFLEHASLAGAFRTAIVAAIGKTLAANWVSDFCS